MTARIAIIISVLFFSCNGGQSKQQGDPLPGNNSPAKETATHKPSETCGVSGSPDMASTDYLIYLLKNERSLNECWIQKLKGLDEFVLPLDSMSHLSLIRDWKINDSVSVIILSHANGTGYDEYLLTVKNKKDFVGKVHISDQADSDLSSENPYYYTEYKLINNRNVKLFNHKVTGVEGGEEEDKIVSAENWAIQDNGEVVKK
jgi:hypothetical protein